MTYRGASWFRYLSAGLIVGPSLRAVGQASGLPGAVAPASVPAIKWAAGWLLWRDFKGRKIQLAEALKDLKEFGADGIEFTPRPGESRRWACRSTRSRR